MSFFILPSIIPNDDYKIIGFYLPIRYGGILFKLINIHFKKTTNDYLISALAARERPAGAQSHYPIPTLVIVEIGILLYTIGKRSAIA